MSQIIYQAQLTATELADLDARARVVAMTVFDRPVVLEAGAGTGKTATLVGRIVTWTLGPGWDLADSRDQAEDRVAAGVLGGVAAITFTDAAAAEMAGRVGEALTAVAAGEVPVGMGPVLGGRDGATRARRARALLGALDHLQVSTIHAFCRRLLAAHPFEAGLHPRFEVDADGARVAEIVHETVDDWLSHHFREAAPTVDEGDAVEAPSLMGAVLTLAGAGLGPQEIAAAVGRLVEDGVPPEVVAEDPFTEPVLAELLGRARAATAGLSDIVDRAFEGAERAANAIALRDGLHALHNGLFDLPATRAGLRRARRLLDQHVPQPLRGHLRKSWARGEPAGREEAACIGGRRFALRRATLDFLRIVGHLTGLDPALYDAARRVVAPLVAAARGALVARGVQTFDALLADAHRLLTTDAAVRRQARAGIRQLLVDEFQDTDALQCAIIRALALPDPGAADLGPPPGLFVVGDPKQSIYGWRNADLAAYDGFVAEIVAAGGLHRRLGVNYRSTPAILDEVERLVAGVMQPEPGLQPSFAPLVAGASPGPEPSAAGRQWAAVEHWVSWPLRAASGRKARVYAHDIAALEATAIARDLAELAQDPAFSWGDAALLFRGMSDQEVYLGALRAAGIPYSVERDRSYYRRREVIDASALVRVILDPSDELALLTLLRSPLVGAPDAALLPLWHAGFPALMSQVGSGDPAALEAATAAARQAIVATPRDVPGLDRIEGWDALLLRAIGDIAACRDAFDELPADAFVERLRLTFLPEAIEGARYLGAYRIANLGRFFVALSTSLDAAGSDVESTLRALRVAVGEAREAEEGRPPEALTDAVRVMTVHKAKGLAFDHVYVAQTHKQSPPQRGRGRLTGSATQARRAIGSDRWALSLFGLPGPSWDAHQARDARVERAERVRLLYVATTRARRRLVLMGRWPEQLDGTLRPEDARSMLELVQQRAAGVPDLAAAHRSLASARADAVWWHDEADARWVFPALAPERPAPATGTSDDTAAASSEGAGPAAPPAFDAALARMDRPRTGTASGRAHLAEDATSEEAPAPTPEDVRSREIAMAVGSAVHLALEHLDLALAAPEAVQRQVAELRRYVTPFVAPRDVSAAERAATGILERFAGGALHQQMRALAGHIIARELPVLLPPGDGPDAAVGFIAGAIDLVYRDPADGAWVVVDYKTDRVSDDAALAERVSAYAAQGAVYQEALQRALDLPVRPRFELWFIRRDACVRVP